MGPRLQDFEIIATIGSGSHGTVRKVRRIQDDQILVWKELSYGSMSESEKQGLVTEVNLLRELRHPNVVKFLHHIVDRKTTTLYIIMEHCPGGDLNRLISKCRQTSTFLEEGFIWRVLKQICEALKVCHSRDLRGGRIILHRDIKPANVFLDAEGDVKLGDFGLARTLNSEASFARTFVGTPYYMSPEVINGQEYNEKSDMWSLGCLIYELCALHPPFQATSHKQLAAKIREARYERIPIQYSNSLQEILNLLLTYEDFLRPTALMIIHHSAMAARTSKNEVANNDPMYESLNPTVLLNSGNKDRKSSALGSEERISCSYSSGGEDLTESQRDCSTALVEKGESYNEGTSTDGKIIDIDSGCSKQRFDIPLSSLSATYGISNVVSVSDDRITVSGVQVIDDDLNVDAAIQNTSLDRTETNLDDSIEKIYKAVKEASKANANSSPDIITQADLLRPDCACGGMPVNKWRERILTLREAEAAVRERELDVKERERDVMHREHRVATMEREARQHLIRAQIYLRQSRNRKNAATSPHRPPSDLDTTVSADIGDDNVQTVAKLDPQKIENPFLKMRGMQPQPEKRVSFEKEKQIKFKSNTLDNPKSRLKRGNIFGLVDRASETKTDAEEIISVVAESRAPLKTMNINNQGMQQNQKSRSNPSLVQEKSAKTIKKGLHMRRNSRDELRGTPQGQSTCNRLERCSSSENLTKKHQIKVSGEKENVPVIGKKAPEVKPSLKTWKPNGKFTERLLKREGSGKKNQKVPVLQFYNVV